MKMDDTGDHRVSKISQGQKDKSHVSSISRGPVNRFYM